MFWRGRRCICYERTYPLGRSEHPARSAPDSKFRPAIRARCVDGDSPDGTLRIFSLRRFNPDDGCRDVSIASGLRAFHGSLTAIYFRRGIVRPRGNQMRKRTGDHERSVWLPGLAPVFDPVRCAFNRASADPALGFASLRVSGTTKVQSSGHDPARIISLRKPLPAPIRSWVCRQNDGDETQTQTGLFANRVHP